MSDDPPKSYTGREIVLDLFPATPQRLIPRTSAYLLRRDGEGGREVWDRRSGKLLGRLSPVARAQKQPARLCCDLCHASGPARDLQFFRTEVPGFQGRRLRYLTACVDSEGCEARRLEDGPIDRLWAVDTSA